MKPPGTPVQRCISPTPTATRQGLTANCWRSWGAPAGSAPCTSARSGLGRTPARCTDWRPLADDLAQFLDQQKLPRPIGAGHSLGASSTLRLALRQPQRFSALALVDPVLFTPAFSLGWRLASALGLKMKVHPLAAATLRRRRCFENRQAMFDNYRQKPVFARLDDAQLWDYVDAVAQPSQDGTVQLSYSPEWEAHIYLTGALADPELWPMLKTFRLPMLLIRGEQSQVCTQAIAKRIQQAAPQTQIVSIPGAGHLVALEKPQEVARNILEFTEKNLNYDNL